MTDIPEEEDGLFDTTKKDLVLQPKDFTFEGEVQGVSIESLDHVHKYLAEQLGQDKLNRCYPILRDFGDKILSEDNMELLVKALSPYLTRQEVKKYYQYLC